MEKRFFVYLLTFIQWLIFIAIILPFINQPIITTGSKVDGGVKVIQTFQLWILFSSAVLSILFHKIRTKDSGENYVTVAMVLTTFFSSINLALHFADDFPLWIILTRSITEGLYFALGIISALKVIIQSTNYLIHYSRKNQHQIR
jgi:hypothetical protein